MTAPQPSGDFIEMNDRNAVWKGPAVWTLALGLVLGGLGTASVQTGKHSSPPVVAKYPAPKAVVESTSTSTAPTSLRSLDEQYAALAERVSPAVVTIKVEGTAQGMFGDQVKSGGEGSGVIFRPDGYIVTNDHVAGGMAKVTVVLQDGREFPGKVIRAPEMDIAVVKIEANDLPSLPFGNSDTVKPGQAAMAIGAPFGLENSVTIGHVSATKRINQIPDPRSGSVRIYWDVVQTDAPINMGNSGGPLVNIDGEVIGINSSIQSATGNGSGIGFAISSNQARMLAESLIEKGKITRSFMGVRPEDMKPYQRKELGLEGGAYLAQVTSDGPGAMAGLKTGDVVTKVEDVAVATQTDLRNAMLKYAPGTKVTVEYVRSGKPGSAEVALTKVPESERPTIPQVPDDLRSRIPMPKEFDFGQKAPENDDVPPMGRARLGVQIESVTNDNRKQYSIPSGASGAVVTSVEPGTPAAKAGIQPGDVIEQIGDRKVASASALREAMSDVKWGDKKAVRYSRFNGNSRQSVTLDVVFR